MRPIVCTYIYIYVCELYIYVMDKPQQIPQMYGYKLCNPSNERFFIYDMMYEHISIKKSNTAT